MSKFIYTVTAITKEGGRSRCFGYYFGQQKAYEAALGNYGGMDECLYDYLVIEKIGPGIHAIVDSEQVFWFKWLHEKGFDGCWIACKKPQGERFERTIGWAGIG